MYHFLSLSGCSTKVCKETNKNMCIFLREQETGRLHDHCEKRHLKNVYHSISTRLKKRILECITIFNMKHWTLSSLLNASKSSTRKLIRLRNFYGKHYLFQGKTDLVISLKNVFILFYSSHFHIFTVLHINSLDWFSLSLFNYVAQNSFSSINRERTTIKMNAPKTTTQDTIRRTSDCAKLTLNHFSQPQIQWARKDISLFI